MSLNRRQFIRTSAAAGFALGSWPLISGCHSPGAPASGSRHRIDRNAVVRRHNPVVTSFDPFSALSLGNGEFAFTADFTGLQTFAPECADQFPLCTTSHWAWHTVPAPSGLRREDLRLTDYDTYGRPVGYATDAKGQEPLFNWLRQNPHRLHLGQIGLHFPNAAANPPKPTDCRAIRQHLDLWTGLLESQFEYAGQRVQVRTCCHPKLALVAVRIESPLLAQGRLAVRLAFPYGSPEVSMADWDSPGRHETKLTRVGTNRINFSRKLDNDRYEASLAWNGEARLESAGPHQYLLGTQATALEFVCHFSKRSGPKALPGYSQTESASAAHWSEFWSHGGAIDLGACTDARAPELERRLVLSQYQTAIHCAGSLPSAETGLLCNSWYGKFHLEMHWWHSVHFAAWNRFALFENSLGIYRRILPIARQIAQRQGYRGARWPKMIGPDGYDSPSPVGPLLLWQQPHPIYYAELCYRERPTRQTLDYWSEVVFETAEFMTSYAVLDGARNQYVLGPPMKTVSENADTLTTRNPTFELAYWRFGLRTAQTWRERLGLKRQPGWDDVLNRLSPLPVSDDGYLMQEGMTDTYTKWNWEHPALVGALGMQPGDGVSPDTMRRTVRRVMEVWQWERTWGWDFPMMAMAAARVGEPELAVQALLIDVPKNRHWPNGHNYQREHLTAYLPGNGGLLSALAMMAAGWTAGPRTNAPGFPANGKWTAKSENLRQWL